MKYQCDTGSQPHEQAKNCNGKNSEHGRSRMNARSSLGYTNIPAASCSNSWNQWLHNSMRNFSNDKLHGAEARAGSSMVRAFNLPSSNQSNAIA